MESSHLKLADLADLTAKFSLSGQSEICLNLRAFDLWHLREKTTFAP
jgi:hypothetical protein